MLSFAVYTNGQAAKRVNLSGAYVVGTDDVPLRADITFRNGVVSCKKRAAGPAGLALLWKVPGAGAFMLETIRVPEREKPYILQVELARARLMRINQKLEDWGFLDATDIDPSPGDIVQARDALIRALQADTPAEAAAIGDEALALAVTASERLSRFHAETLLDRRKTTSGFGRKVFGCSATLNGGAEPLRQPLAEAFDFVTVPMVWRDIEPSEQTFNWKPLDDCVEQLAKLPIPMKGSSLLSFNERHVPDWLYIWEHDFDTIRDLAFEHARRLINRYGQHIQMWDVISGIHANNCFTFNFEQLMELTRMTAALAKQLSPRATTIVDLVAPWGEYYARSQRTIPPLLYADMTVQSGVVFDAFGLQFRFGPGEDGMYVRDMFQISSLIDMFAKLGKTLHITAVEAPSDTFIPRDSDGSGANLNLDGGMWREPWTEGIQADWVRQFMETVLSKVFVESVSWHGLADIGRRTVPNGGLLRSDLTHKPAFDVLAKMRADLVGASRTAPRGLTT